jgi:2-desacetyl-2-hydroxyethyl bacteriochlorophyllide A dehydrogenase
MKAVVKGKPGPGVEIMEVDKPKIKPFEVLVKVQACAICGTDVDRYRWVGEYPKSMIKYLPVILGHEFAGEIAEVGEQVKELKPNDRVAIEPLVSCGRCSHCLAGRPNHCKNMAILGATINGGMAEFVAVPASNCFIIPENISYSAATHLQTLAMTIHALDFSPIMPGDTVVVQGPGPVGLSALQLAKAVGASKIFITGLKKDVKRLEIAKKLGGDPINVEEEDPVQKVKEFTGGEGADVVIEASGSPKAAAQSFEMVRARGSIYLIGLVHEPVNVNLEKLVLKEIRIFGIRSRGNFQDNWRRAINLVAMAKVNLDYLIDHIVPIEKSLEGFELLIEGKAVGVVITPYSTQKILS